MNGALVVDFDGVVCDAFEECALITWLGLHGVDPDLSVSTYLRAMPQSFLDRFAHVRNYARTLDQFVVAHVTRGRLPGTQDEFDRVFTSLSPEYVYAFVGRANGARERCRTEEPAFWLGLHTLYPGIADLLQRNAGNVYIITAKDTGSVWSVLRANGLDHTVQKVYGEVSRKDDAMVELCVEYELEVTDAVFIDDNLTNVRRVLSTGASARWATWGYHTPEDIRRADVFDVRRLSLATLHALAA